MGETKKDYKFDELMDISADDFRKYVNSNHLGAARSLRVLVALTYEQLKTIKNELIDKCKKGELLSPTDQHVIAPDSEEFKNILTPFYNKMVLLEQKYSLCLKRIAFLEGVPVEKIAKAFNDMVVEKPGN